MRLIFRKPSAGGAAKDVSRIDPDEERIGRTTKQRTQNNKQQNTEGASQCNTNFCRTAPLS